MTEQADRRYDPHAVEARRQAAWTERDAFRTPAIVEDRPHLYIKPSAPFTSGNVHIGHVRSYSIGDAYARFRRARGEDVLFAFGFDAFGLPAELGAIAGGEPPTDWVTRCADHMKGQLQRLGFSLDWERAFLSSDEIMYRWSQWLFLTLYEAGLVYRGTGTVDWCDNCQTTLASIQVEAGGTCWRCHNPVRLIELPQWYFKVSAYVTENDSRLGEREASGKWDKVALDSQLDVMGRVDGVEVQLSAPDGSTVTAFTPHANAVSGAAFVVISPRHPEAERWASDPAIAEQLEQMRSGGWVRSARDAETIPVIQANTTMTDPSGRALPVLISPVVDARFGPTIALGVPSEDRTDEVIAGRMGLASEDGEASAADSDAVAAQPAVRYKASDWVISRQRSWGTPIPVVYCEQCGMVPVAKSELPVVLPLDITPTGTGNPLAELEDFVNTTCPACGGSARRETDTLDCHFDALWLWIPACVPPESRDEPLEEILALPDLRHWLPSERLVAGSDSGNFVFDQRTVTKALRDIGPLAFLADGEPFAGCLFHEMVTRDNRKMSKHLGNVVDPDELVDRYGADTVRLAVLFAARPQKSLNWSDSAVLRCNRFLAQVWDYSHQKLALSALGAEQPAIEKDTSEHLRLKLEQWCEAAVQRITADMESLEMHSAVRNLMRLFDRIKDFEKRVLAREPGLSAVNVEALLGALTVLAQMLGPLVPHISEELWIAFGNEDRGSQTPWPGVSLVIPA
ncbi:MAG TPA: class I tRNA ligase family protein [Solirubrobacteraceae bacterium]|nr:class I tRNA ligase family protein [Solirubrobacteraceae bacterium]